MFVPDVCDLLRIRNSNIQEKMDKLVPADVLKVFQSIVLPLELKINSLLDVVKSLEAKIDELTAGNEGKQKNLAADKLNVGQRQLIISNNATVKTGSRTPTTQRVDTKSDARPVTRRQRALALTTSAQVTSKSPIPSPIVAAESSTPPITASVPDTAPIAAAGQRPPPAHAQPKSQSDSVEVNNEWTEVSTRRSRVPRNVVRGEAEKGKIALEAAERWRYYHLYYVKEGTSDKEITEHLKILCANEKCVVETLKSRGRYASFKIGVLSKFDNQILDGKNWPEDICIKAWRNGFRRQTEAKQD